MLMSVSLNHFISLKENINEAVLQLKFTNEKVNSLLLLCSNTYTVNLVLSVNLFINYFNQQKNIKIFSKKYSTQGNIKSSKKN